MSDLLWRLHSGLPRQAPGSAATTRRMLAAVAPQPKQAALDIGCGPGAAAVELAQHGLHVTAVDTHEPFLDEARQRAERHGVSQRLVVEPADMTQLPYADGSFDVLWAEGSAYIMGFAEALGAWRRLMRPGGRAALTELAWTTERPAAEARSFWGEAYPNMKLARENVTVAEQAGYTVLDWWVLPDSDWWDEYYGVLQRRIDALGTEGERNEAAPISAELELRRRHASQFGYAAYIVER